MADHQSSHVLSPQLSTVLSSLSISLEAELNRYRRNRRFDGLAEEDLFAEIDDPSFDLDAVERAVEASVARTATLARPLTPPPVPHNKKLTGTLAAGTLAAGAAGTDLSTEPSSAITVSTANLSTANLSEETLAALQPATSASGLAVSEQPYLAAQAPATIGQSGPLVPHPEAAASLAGNIAPTGYLASSEKLIESLAEGPPMPEPVDTNAKPKRKTVSLLAGATLGFCGLVAGLGASYLMANPLVTQRLASSFQGESREATVATQKAFDPLGPDLSANEFIDLEIDNLSSLKMPQATIELAAGNVGDTSEAALANPANTNSLPPIENEVAEASLPTTGSANNPPQTPTLASAPMSPASIETQAVVIPTGLTYYVTMPFTTEQTLITIRESVSEAFVRRFSDGDRIQIAAFDNPQAAGNFVEELKSKSITAQIYGPTTE